MTVRRDGRKNCETNARRYARKNVRQNVKRYAKNVRQKEYQTECQKRCQKECQKMCQKECQKEGQKMCQKDCQKECQKRCRCSKNVRENARRYARKNVRPNVRRYARKHVRPNVRRYAKKGQTERMSDRTSEEMPERMSERLSKDVPERMSEEMPDRMSGEMPERMPKMCQQECQKDGQKMCQKDYQKECQKRWQKECRKESRRYARKNNRQNVRRYAKNVRQKEYQTECQKRCQNVRRCARKKARRCARKTVRKNVREMPERMPEDMPEIMREERMPERMSEDIPERIKEKNCHKICRKECQKECQKRCQKEWQNNCHEICPKECQKIFQEECQTECQRLSDIMSEDLKERSPGDTPGSMSDRSSGDSQRMPDRMTQRMSDRMFGAFLFLDMFHFQGGSDYFRWCTGLFASWQEVCWHVLWLKRGARPKRHTCTHTRTPGDVGSQLIVSMCFVQVSHSLMTDRTQKELHVCDLACWLYSEILSLVLYAVCLMSLHGFMWMLPGAMTWTGWVGCKGFWARRTASCREALGRQSNVSLWQSCVLKRGCVLLCFSCLSKPNFVELGKAEISKELFCIQCWIWNWCLLLTRLESQTLMESPLYAALEIWEKRGLEEETAMHEVAVACMARGWKVRFLCLLCWHKQNLTTLTWQPPPDMSWWVSLEVKYFFVNPCENAKIHAQVQIGSFPHQGRQSKHKLRSYHLVVCFFLSSACWFKDGFRMISKCSSSEVCDNNAIMLFFNIFFSQSPGWQQTKPKNSLLKTFDWMGLW